MLIELGECLDSLHVDVAGDVTLACGVLDTMRVLLHAPDANWSHKQRLFALASVISVTEDAHWAARPRNSVCESPVDFAKLASDAQRVGLHVGESFEGDQKVVV